MKANNSKEKMIDKEIPLGILEVLRHIAKKSNRDINEIIQEKLKKNNKKYPINKAKNNSKKYNEL